MVRSIGSFLCTTGRSPRTMNLWTILAREFRVLCRRRSNHAARIVLTGMVTATWALLFAYGTDPSDNLMAMSAVAQILFCFGAAIALSDTIGAERRNRTLGLLLLTPLRPREVLLGKLFTGISRFLLCLAAILPILALPLLEGEVTPADVVRQFAGILGITFLGMSTGLFASVIRPQPTSSAGIAITLLLLFYLGPMLAALLLDITDMLPRRGGFLWIGPLLFLIPEMLEDNPELGSWFLNMGILAALCLVLLLLSLGLFHMVWNRERQSRGPGRRSAGSRRIPPPIGDGINPYLAFRRRHQPVRLHRVWTGLLLLGSIATCPPFLFARDIHEWRMVSYILGLTLHVLAYWWICLNATCPLHEERRCGMLELVLISPLHPRSIRTGLFHRPGFLWTLLLLLGWNLALIWAGVRLSSLPSVSGSFESEFYDGILYLHLGALLLIPLELFAIRAVGLWWSWHSGKPNRAAIVLFLVHVVLPVPLFVAIVLILDMIPGSIGRWLMRTPIPCIIIWTLIRGILALALLLWSHPNNRDNMVRSRAGSMPG